MQEVAILVSPARQDIVDQLESSLQRNIGFPGAFNAQRQDCAWRLVNAGFMHDDVSAASGISRPQVTIVRRVKRHLGDTAVEVTSWRNAMRLAKGTAVELTPDELETMLAAQAQDYADRMPRNA